MDFRNIPQKISSFFKEVSAEVKKVDWPRRKKIIRDTLIVLGVSIMVAAFLGGIDFIVSTLLEKFVL